MRQHENNKKTKKTTKTLDLKYIFKSLIHNSLLIQMHHYFISVHYIIYKNTKTYFPTLKKNIIFFFLFN